MADTPFVSLYRRFRPGRFDELKGQDHVVRALQSAVRDDRVSHAYLFSGPRGTGKTSSARILAKALNCAKPVDGEPCGVCTSCTEITQGTSLDVHELDAASNNGVDAMRDLVAHAALGTPGRWKVYIVDEVHMLSNAAANALLKTLEEPPSHVVFVLATTDPQKVPPTIRSRTQHLEFRLIGPDTLRDLLVSVREQAGLKVDDDSVQAAVRRGRGSARDALSALDQVAASGTSDAARPELSDVLSALGEGEVAPVLVSLSTLLAGGWGPQQLATDLVDDLRQVFLAALAPELCAVSGSSRADFTALAQSMGLARVVRSMEILGQALIDMRDAPDAQVVLEIAVVRATRPELDSGIEALTERVAALERHNSADVMAARTAARAEASAPAVPTPTAPPAAPAAPAPASSPPDVPAPASIPQAVAPPAPTSEPPAVSESTARASTRRASAPGEVGRRPSVGAVRRRQEGPNVGAGAPGVAAAPAPTPTPTPTPTGATAGTPSGRVVDRDSLTQAWGDGVLHSLSARAKALFSAGRFVASDEKGAQFALPNAAHRDRCTELAPQVEAALTAHFGAPVRLVLVVDGGNPGGETGGPTAAPSRPDGPAGPAAPSTSRDTHLEEADEVDPEELVAATRGEIDEESAAEARLLEAFPGTSEVAE